MALSLDAKRFTQSSRNFFFVTFGAESWSVPRVWTSFYGGPGSCLSRLYECVASIAEVARLISDCRSRGEASYPVSRIIPGCLPESSLPFP